MKIICFIPSLGSGGAERQLVNLSIMWKKMNNDVEFIIYHNQIFYQDILDKEGIPVQKLDFKNKFSFLFNLYSYLKKSKADIVVSFLYTPNTILGFLSYLPHKWKFFSSELSYRVNFNKGLRGKLLVFSQKNCNMLIANSHIGASLWLNKVPFLRERIKTIYNPVIINNAQRGQYIPLNNHKLNIVVAASYQELKNMAGLIEGVALLDSSEKDAIHIDWYGKRDVGQGDTSAFNRACISLADHNLDSVISLHDATKDIYDKMIAADVIGLFSKLEGLPNTICEGLSLGKPIIMTKVSDYDILVDSKNGFLCEWDKPETIRDAIRSCLSLSSGELLKMGEQSKMKAARLFDPNQIANEWLNCFKYS